MSAFFTRGRVSTALMAVLSAFLLVASGDRAAATLIGDMVTVEADFGFPVINTTDTVMVGGGIEFQGGDSSQLSTVGAPVGQFLFPGDSIDIGAEQIDFVFADVSLVFPFIIRFLDLDWTGSPGIVDSVDIINPNGDVQPGAQANVLGGGDGIEFQGGVDLSGGAAFSLRLNVTHTQPPQGIPEPAALPLFATGILALWFLGRRRGLFQS